MKKLLKKFDFRHLVCLLIAVISLLLSIFVYNSSFTRIAESGIDIKNSFLFYLFKVFSIGTEQPITVNNYSTVVFAMPFNLPDTWEEFQVLWGKYWQVWATAENFSLYLNSLNGLLFIFAQALLVIIPVILIVFIIKNISADKQNNNYNKDSKSLTRFKKFERKICLPIKNAVKAFFNFVKENSFWYKIWICVWVFNFNFIPIVLEFISYYFYFVANLDFSTLYIQFIKLLKDLCPLFNTFPLFVWILFGLLIINKIRRKVGYARLEHRERCNRGFINERPIVLMVCGTMGKKKTTMITDIALSQEIMFRDKAFEKILECDLKFPFFPYINLENSIKKAIDNHTIYNLATCKRFVRSKKIKFYKRPKQQNIFGYKFDFCGCDYNNKLTIQNIWDVIETYTQLYFIYIVQSSLLISNYSIRVDNVLQSVGNFPLWNSEFFKKDPSRLSAYSRHSHILDFDSLRLGKKLIQENKYKDSFEFGVINITEIGKERGNNLELQELKKKTDDTNQKNDLFNSWLKLVRHSATVDNFPFVKVITDDQRPESWGADARDLCELVFIDESSELKLAMPLFNLGSLFFEWWQKRFSEKYYKYRYNRADNTLPMYLYHGISALFYRYASGIYNTFGYYVLNCSIESGRQDGEVKQSKYFLMTKKIYSKRFSTDCFSDYFNEKSLRSMFGLDDLQEFKTEKASFEELMRENSYFFNDLIKLKDKDK